MSETVHAKFERWRRTGDSSIGLRDDGWFRFENAPLGEFRVRVGSRRQLERGEFRLERKVEFAENGPPLEIDARKGEETTSQDR